LRDGLSASFAFKSNAIGFGATARTMIADLDRGSHSHNAAVALQLLATFRHVQDQNVAHRDRILEELEQ
jgi:hypothetical protein